MALFGAPVDVVYHFPILPQNSINLNESVNLRHESGQKASDKTSFTLQLYNCMEGKTFFVRIVLDPHAVLPICDYSLRSGGRQNLMTS